MPIIVLHHDVYFLYADQDRPYLAQHSRTMATELAEVFAERAGTPAAAAYAGWTLTSFGAYLWSPSSIGASAGLFYRAYLVDPGNPLALRGLAAAHERAGEYEKAIEYLMNALALERGDPELMLRLALCGWRRDEATVDTVIATLKSLTAADSPEWIRSVAYQELARAHLSKGDSEVAETLLRQGLQELPGDQQMSLQLATILDGQRRRSEALAVIDAIRIDGWEKYSPRQIYDFWSPSDMKSVRTDLRQEMQGGMAALAASLAGPPPATPSS
jgi:tetratricopeptide (TPR) repeat protein